MYRRFKIHFADGSSIYEDDHSSSREEGEKIVAAKYPAATRINCVAEETRLGPEYFRDPKYWEPGYGPPID